MKFIIALLSWLAVSIIASAETVGPLSFAVPGATGWSLDLDQELPNDTKYLVWSSADASEGVIVMHFPLPKDASGTLDDYVPDWRKGFEKKAAKVFSGGFTEIGGRRFGYSKIQADTGAGRRVVRQVCTIVGVRVYCLAIYSDRGDPDENRNLKAVVESIRVKEG